MKSTSPAPISSPERRPWILLFVAVCLVAINLRITINGVGPLLEEIAADQGVRLATLGALASLPLIAWGLFSPLAHGVSARLGLSRAVTCSLIILAAGTLWRSLPGSPANLWLGTALTGLGLAIGNALMPAAIKRDFGTRVPLVMGVYTAMLGGAGALASGLVVPISQTEVAGEPLGWQVALLATGAILPVAILVWIWANRRRVPPRAPVIPFDSDADSSREGSRAAPQPDAPAAAPNARPYGERRGGRPGRDDSGRRVWSDPLAWLVSLYMGSQSAVFYMLSTWLAPYLTSLGTSPVVAGIELMAFQLIGILGSLLLPAVARGRLNRSAPVLVATGNVVMCIGLVAAPGLAPLWLILGGLSSGASLTMGLTLMAVRARTHGHASALSGMAQSVGYLIAAVGPTVFGLLHGWSGGWILPFGLIGGVALVQLLIGFSVGKDRFVLEDRA